MSEEAKEAKRTPPTPEELFGHESNIHTAGAVLHMLQHMVYRLEKDKGWYDTEVTMDRMAANLHSEVSEMHKAWRDHGFEKYYTQPLVHHAKDSQDRTVNAPPKPEGVAIEMADVLIRLLGDAERCGISLLDAFMEKMLYNWTRPYRHGRGLDKP